MQHHTWLMAVYLALAPQSAAAQATLHCADLDATKPFDAHRAFECISAMDEDLKNAQSEIIALRDQVAQLSALSARVDALTSNLGTAQAATVPAMGDHPGTRAVVAYVSAKGEKTCPKGWAPFEAAKDRFILGAGARYPVVGTTGGEADVTLTEAHLPPHAHRSEMEYGWDVGGNGGSKRIDVGDGAPWNNETGHVKTTNTGDGRPHNNMPPYIALYFCQKSD